MKSGDTRFKVVLPLAPAGESEKYSQKFSELGAEFIGQRCENDDEFIALARDADVIITVGSIRPVPRKIIENLEQCRLISNTQIGYDSIDTAAAAERWHRPVLEVERVMRGEWPKAIVNPQAKEKYVSRWGRMKEPG